MNSTSSHDIRALAAIVVYNEGEKLRTTLETIPDTRSFDVVIVDDASTDDVDEILADYSYPVVRHDRNYGVGRAIKSAVAYAQEHGYDTLVIAAGNGKMQLYEAENLLAPIREEGVEYVQGSRYLSGGRYDNLPLFRRVTIPIFTWLVWLFTGYRGTDATCGFRAYKLSMVELPGMDIWQEWLDQYEFEFYVHFYVMKHRRKVREVPVSMIYPKASRDYSKIKAITGWWSMLRPWVFLKLGLRK